MKKIILTIAVLLIGLTNLVSANHAPKQLKILQLNIWHGTNSVPNGFIGLVNIIEQTAPDVVLLCEASDNEVVSRLLDTLNRNEKRYYGENTNQSTAIISKYEIQKQSLCCYEDGKGPITKSHIQIAGQTFAFYSAHLDYLNYACFLPRGYSGTTWKKLEAPFDNADSVLAANRLSQRDEAITAFMKDAQKEIKDGHFVILGGDFNEPSHLDWQADTKEMRDHNGLVVNWDCSIMLTDMGMKDAYRELYPDPVKYPGFTFPSSNNAVDVSKLSWAPDADERDRIDFVYYFPNKHLKLLKANIVGPSGSVLQGREIENDASDVFIEPKGIWPTDHKGNLVIFEVSK